MPDLTSTTVTTNVLKIPIKLYDGSKITYNLQDPKTGLSKNDLIDETKDTGFAGYVVSENLIDKNGLQGVETQDPYYYNTEKIIFD